MKSRMLFAVALSLVFIMGFTLGKPVAQSMSKSRERPLLVGARVEDSQRDYLGEIVEVVDGPEGRVAFAVLRYWISDDTQARVAVPLGAFSCEGQACVLQSNRDILESAPPLISKDDLNDPKKAENIYRYFGVQPYWSDEE